MRVMTQHTTGGPEVLEAVEVPTPTPGPGEVRIRVGAAGVNPVDVAVRAGAFPLLGEPPFTLGWDVAGTVDAVGPGVDAFTPGDRVLGMPRFPAEAGAYADHVIAPAAELVRTPDVLDDRSAAALPLVGLTAHLALVEVADVQAGQRVLVLAAGGGVGHVAVQIAKARGAYVIATASPRKTAFVTGLGADEVIDYTTTDITAAVGPVDVVIDPFGGDDVLERLDLLRPGGVVVSLLDVPESAQTEARRRGVRLVRIGVVPNAGALAGLVALIQDGVLDVHVAASFPLDRAGDAHEHLAEGPEGKLVLVP